ncbi:hypothetical protein CEXT_352531 [Caerostris extrusa]|uniref:Uncharacterized protein n=1 Tax=Caerostris extrusa TaxID=172846 RepID=A0AAV4NYE5_CAEEX|nr:hypothetical protein CEXT_352531 [Caerostris extrusa]
MTKKFKKTSNFILLLIEGLGCFDPISKVHEKRTRKCMPKRDLLYVILTQNSPGAYEVANLDSPITSIGAYPFSALKLFTEVETIPHVSLGKRRRHKKSSAASSTSRRM